jgi:hypothetical protein
MKTIYSNEEAESLVHNGVLAIEDDLEIAFNSFEINANIYCFSIYSEGRKRSIKCQNIDALRIEAANITAANINVAWDLEARHIKAHNINAQRINAHDIKAHNINAYSINAWDINARDIDASNIFAKNITYYAMCFAYKSIRCQSIQGDGRLEKTKHLCLDGDIFIKE